MNLQVSQRWWSVFSNFCRTNQICALQLILILGAALQAVTFVVPSSALGGEELSESSGQYWQLPATDAAVDEAAADPFAFSGGESPIQKYAQVDNGVFRGALPGELGIRFLSQNGIRTIVNLNDSWNEKNSEREWAEAAGIQWFDESINAFLGPSRRQMERILELISDPHLQPVFFHCHHGKDRTGLVAGLYRVWIQKWDANRAYQEMLGFGFDPRLILLDRFFWRHSGKGLRSSESVENGFAHAFSL